MDAAPNNTKKVSEIDVNDLAAYLHISAPSEKEIALLSGMLEAAKAYICKYTGLTPEKVDECADIPITVYVLVQDMFDVRSYYVNTSNVNKVVTGILDLHSVNLLPSVEVLNG